jgi:hypothetical protein
MRIPKKHRKIFDCYAEYAREKCCLLCGDIIGFALKRLRIEKNSPYKKYIPIHGATFHFSKFLRSTLPKEAKILFCLVYENYNKNTFEELDIIFSAFETNHPELKSFISEKREDVFEKYKAVMEKENPEWCQRNKPNPIRLVELRNEDKLVDIEFEETELEYKELNKGEKIPVKIKKQIEKGLFSSGTDFGNWQYKIYWNFYPCNNPDLEIFICEKCKVGVVAYKSFCPFCKFKEGKNENENDS